MSEPKTTATAFEEVLPGLFHWQINDERIRHISDSCAVVGKGTAVVIDPVPLDEAALGRLGTVEAIVLATPSHQRAAWSLRRRTGARVHAPRGAQGLDEKPDVEFGDGDRLPGGLRAVHAPGPGAAHHALHLETGPGALFLPDVVMNEPDRGLVFLSDKYMKDPAAARASVKRLLDSKFGVLCFGHGAPIKEGGRAALADLLKKDAAAKG